MGSTSDPRYSPAFLTAVERVLEHEGGYVDDPADPGGRTNFGISQRAYPNLDVRALTREAAIEIYFRDYWSRYALGSLPDAVAAKMLDLVVNLGAHEAFVLLQRAVRAVSGEAELTEDGLLGPRTLAAVWRVAGPNSPGGERALLAALRAEAAGHYRLIAARHPEREKFLHGWLRRAYA